MEALILAIILTYALKKAVEDGSRHWQSSKAANRSASRGRSVPRRAASAVQHDAGYWLHQVLHGFPRTRQGLTAGWHAGRQAQAEGAVARHKAKADHLALRARLLPEIREHRRRQDEALAAIRAARKPEPVPAVTGDDPAPAAPAPPEAESRPAVTCKHEGVTCMYGYCPCPCPDCGGTFHSPVPGAKYSYGSQGNRLHWPAVDRYQAESQAQYWSTEGKPWVVAEYPPGGGPGRTVATYINSEPVMDCDLCGKPLPPGYTGIAHPECIEVFEQAGPPVPASPTTEGSTGMPTGTASGETTYTQQMNELAAIRQDAEQEVNSVRLKRMVSRLDILMSLGLDKDSLSEAAAIDDALQAQEKAAQQVLDAADAAIHGLKQRHGGIQEAVDSSPVAVPAEPEFYAS